MKYLPLPVEQRQIEHRAQRSKSEIVTRNIRAAKTLETVVLDGIGTSEGNYRISISIERGADDHCVSLIQLRGSTDDTDDTDDTMDTMGELTSGLSPARITLPRRKFCNC